MVRAYSQLKRVLDERKMTVPDLRRQMQASGFLVTRQSVMRLIDEKEPLERLDLRVAGAICQVCRVPLSELIAFERPGVKLRRLPAAKQKRLDALMAKNSAGVLTAAERQELRGLVREAEAISLDNARRLAGRRETSASR